MSTEPRPPVTHGLDEAREIAQAQSSRVSAGLIALVGAVLAVMGMAFFVLMDYKLDQDPHRLLKVLLGVIIMGTIAFKPMFGLFVLPIVTPFLPWMPPVPIPGINPLNGIVFTLFVAWAWPRLMRRDSIFRTGSMGPPIFLILVLAALSILRGAAFPSGVFYDPGVSGLILFRSAVTIGLYFVSLSMIRGEKERRRMAWALAIAVALEAAVTIAYGRNGRGGRAIGSIGQANELGTYLALFAVVSGAMVAAAKQWWQKAFLVATVVMASLGTFMSVSRGAIGALAIGLVYVSLRTSRAMTVVLLLVGLSSPLWLPDYVMERITGTQVETAEGVDSTELEGSAQARVDTWTAIMEIVGKHWWDGVGFAGLGYLLPAVGEELGLEEVKDSSHNTFLRFLGEMGILGLLALLWFFWKLWSMAWRGVRVAPNRMDRQLSVGLGAAVIVLVISCAFGDRFWPVTITGNLWILAAIVDDMLIEQKAAKT